MQEIRLHPNSRKVTFFRTGSFLARAQGPEIQDYFQSSKQSIGSFWESENSNKVHTGLTFKEQNLLMPHLINSDSDDKGFRGLVDTFFHEINSNVLHGTGLTLETGLEDNNDEAVSKDNMPINIGEYVKWRHHIGHPSVAKNKKEADSDARKEFYIFDPMENRDRASKLVKEKDEAMQVYLKLKSEPEKIDMMLTMLKIDPREFTGPTKEDLKIQKLRELSESDPAGFKSVYNVDDLEIKYYIAKMVTVDVLLNIGHSYRITSNKRVLGHSLDETVAFFQDPANEQDIALLKAAMQENSKKPIAPGTKKTVLTPKQIASTM